MYVVYLFKEKKTNKVIYTGSTARFCARMKEHRQQLNGSRKANNIHKYMISNNLSLYKDVSVEIVDNSDSLEGMLSLEENYYFLHKDTIFNERPGEDRSGSYNPRRRKIKCVNDGRVFKTVTECAKYYGKGRTTISNVVRGEKPHTWINNEKYTFEYVNQ